MIGGVSYMLVNKRFKIFIYLTKIQGYGLISKVEKTRRDGMGNKIIILSVIF